jgi:tRNA ligase
MSGGNQLNPISGPDEESVTDLLAKLQISSESSTKRGRARKNVYPVWDNPSAKVTNWKFNEWDYGSSKCKLPIEARGLFTHNGEIVIRGYNKFFNIDEVPQTKWQWIEERTSGPYYLSLKENGCIVFMSGLEDGTLLVTSKNSTGPREDAPNERNHSYVALKWVERHLAKSGYSKKDLAMELRRLNVTAVGELCDDEFEEHVLAYTGDDAGLYLHGLNLNIPKFTTYPAEDVDKFAEKFGFYKTKYLVKDSLSSLQTFLEECADTGSWEGRDVEGFVVRCKAKFDDGTKGDYFFKYKFKEPYLMYRDWREVTRAYLSGKPRNSIKILRHKAVTNQYLDFAIPLLDSDPQLKKQYLENHGIIKVRDMFLNHVGKSGIDLVKEDELAISAPTAQLPTEETKFVIMPVSVIGCGKTTVFAALSRLFGWGHIQNDELDVPAKSKKNALMNGASDLLNDSRVVLVDRNNHKFMEREQIIEDMNERRKNIRYICLNFWPDNIKEGDVWKITRKRIAERGDNHATIKAAKDSDTKVDKIMKGFIGRFQPVVTTKNPDALFDLIIDMNVLQGSRYNLEHAVKVLHETYPMLVPNLPTPQELNSAFDAAMSYKPQMIKPSTAAHGTQEPVRKKLKPAVYFNLEILLPIDTTVVDLIDKFYTENPEVDSTFWKLLKETNQVQAHFHVTIAHKNAESEEEQQLYKELNEKHANKFQTAMKNTNVPLGPKSDLTILSLGHNNKVMALKVDVHNKSLTYEKKKNYHITIGTVNAVKPFASNEMLQNPSSTICKWNIQPSTLENQPLAAFK